MEFGDFKYCYVNTAGSSVIAKDGKYVAVLELTKDGKQKETIIIPDYIDDKPVVQIGMEGIGFSLGIGKRGAHYGRLYLPNTIMEIKDSRYYNTTETKIFLYGGVNLDFLQNRSGSFYLSKNLYDRFEYEKGIDAAVGILQIANVTYISNNETYFIDDCNDGDLIISPPEPMRVGYTFDGWYKDVSFTSEWDFENDTFDASLADPTMMLYARWRSA